MIYTVELVQLEIVDTSNCFPGRPCRISYLNNANEWRLTRTLSRVIRSFDLFYKIMKPIINYQRYCRKNSNQTSYNDEPGRFIAACKRVFFSMILSTPDNDCTKFAGIRQTRTFWHL